METCGGETRKSWVREIGTITRLVWCALGSMLWLTPTTVTTPPAVRVAVVEEQVEEEKLTHYIFAGRR